MKKQGLVTWGKLTSQGKGVKAFTNDKAGNAWLYDPGLLKPGRFITALKMRTNTTANKTVLHRAGRVGSASCRKCKSQPETLAHILGQCTIMKEQTIRRHNELLDFVIGKITSNNKEVAVTKETTYTLPCGRCLKADLIIQDQERVQIFDVTIRYEDNDYLAQGHQDKVDKYTDMLPHLQRDLDRNIAEVLPVVIGARGAIPKATIKSLTKVGITDRKAVVTISLIALRNSIEQYHIFMDYDAPHAWTVDPDPV